MTTRKRDADGKFAAAPEKASAAELEMEVAGAGSDFLRVVTSGGIMVNADEVMTTIAPTKLGKNGQLQLDPYKLHRLMRRADLKYKALISTRKNGVLGKPWRVISNPADKDKERAAKVAAFSQAALKGIKNFHADRQELHDAIPNGWNVSEIMWVQREVVFGEGQSRLGWVPDRLQQRRLGRFGFAEADWSLRYQQTSGNFVPVHPHKFIVHSHGMENEDRHGTAECAEVFWWWFLKHNFVKWWSVFGEKFSQPTVVGKHPPNAKQDQVDRLKRAIKLFQTEYGVVIPNNVEVSLLEAARTGSINTYQTFCEFCDKCMSEALTGQSLATGQGQSGAGSYAQSVTHENVKQEFIEADAQDEMGTTDAQLMAPIALYNFGPDVPHALYVVDYESKNLTADLAQDKDLVNEVGFPMTYGYFADKYNRPLAPGVNRDDVVSGKKATVVQTPGAGGGGGDDEGDGNDGKNGNDGKDEKDKKLSSRTGFNAVAFAKGSKARRAEADKCVEESDQLTEGCVRRGRITYNAIADAVADAANKSEDLEELRSRLELMKGKHVDALATAIARAKVNGFLLGAAQVQRQLGDVVKKNQHGLDGHATHFAKKNLGDFEPLEPTEAIKWFEELVPMGKEELQRVAREAQAKAFTIAGIEERDTLKRIQDKVSEYLQQGKTVAEWKKEYAEIRAEVGLDPVKGYQAEQTFRDNTHRAYGAGRVRAANDPDVKDQVWGYEYMATMDDRTRPEHAALNGFTAERDDPFWYSHTPPWEYGCRCISVPVTKLAAETEGIEAQGTIEVDGAEVDPRTWPASPAFRGLGFQADKQRSAA